MYPYDDSNEFFAKAEAPDEDNIRASSENTGRETQIESLLADFEKKVGEAELPAQISENGAEQAEGSDSYSLQDLTPNGGDQQTSPHSSYISFSQCGGSPSLLPQRNSAGAGQAANLAITQAGNQAAGSYSPYYCSTQQPSAYRSAVQPPKKKRGGLKKVFTAFAAVFAMIVSGGTGAWLMQQSIEVQQGSEALSSSYNTENLGTASTSGSSASGVAAAKDSSVIAAVAQKAGDSVVEISTEYKQFHPFYGQYVSTGAGSGVIMSADGYIITNYHVIEGASAIAVRLHDGTEYQASLVGYESLSSDIAVLKINATGLSSVAFADSDEIDVGQLAVAIGNPLGELGGTVTEGIISATERLISLDNTPMSLLQTSAAINPGNSGGGLFDENGKLVGIVTAKSSGSDIEGLGFAIPSNTVKEIVTQILSKGKMS